jgi:hypothetical protein
VDAIDRLGNSGATEIDLTFAESSTGGVLYSAPSEKYRTQLGCASS